MKRMTRFAGLAAALLVPVVTYGQAPQPTVREIATIRGLGIDEAIMMPNGRVILYLTYDEQTCSIFAYDVAARRSTLVTQGCTGDMSLSRAGDRIAYDHGGDNTVDSSRVWSIAIDPSTGLARGPAQRVTVGEGSTPSFSPDGKLIAYEIHRSRTASDLGLVPASGGPEQILARFDRGIGGMSWSPDGQSISVRVGGGPVGASIQRVPVTGRRTESLLSFTSSVSGAFITDGGRTALYRPDNQATQDGRVAYGTTSGARGEFRIPPSSWLANYSDVLSGRYLLTRVNRAVTAHVLDVSSGAVHDLLPGARVSLGPVWSPDGKRIALQDSTSGNWEITVMNADGTARRQFPFRATNAPMTWSPDGRWLAYVPLDHTTLAVLDPATGATRDVFSTLPDAFRDYTWRSDSKSLVVVTRNAANDRDQVYEARLDGQRFRLRDIGTDLPGFIAGGFISDQSLIVGNPSGKGDLHVVPVSGGAPRVFPRGATTNAWFGVSRDGRQLAFLSQNSDGHITSLALTSADGSSQRSVALPFEADQKNVFPPFTSDGRQVILIGRRQGDSLSSVFLVPLNGDPPKAVARLDGELARGRLGLSPDGKSLVFATRGERVSTLFELELRPLLEAIRKP